LRPRLVHDPAGEPERYLYNLEGSPAFEDQEQAFEWHAANCPELRRRGIVREREE